MGDFTLDNGKVGKGVISSVLAAVKYLVIPTIIVTILISLLNGMGAEEYLPMYQLDMVRTSLMIFAIPIIAIAFFVGFYPKGSYSRMTFGIAYVALICVWLWFAALGGKIESSIDVVGVGVEFAPLLLLFMFAVSLKALFYLAEAPSFREEFLRKKEEDARQAKAPPQAAVAPGESTPETGKGLVQTVDGASGTEEIQDASSTDSERTVDSAIIKDSNHPNRIIMPRPHVKTDEESEDGGGTDDAAG